MTTPTFQERIAGGLWGSLVGDALGVPVEFRSREEVQRDPVVGMRGYVHDRPQNIEFFDGIKNIRRICFFRGDLG